MTLSMQTKSKSKSRLVRSTLEYFGVDPDSREERFRAYGTLLGTLTLAGTAFAAGAVYLMGVSLIW